jgi:hypothetical protein
MTSINSKKKGQAKKTSKIAAPAQTYPAPSPTSVTHPEPEPSQKLETTSPESVEEKIPFSFTKEEKNWLTTTIAEPLILPEESAKWAGFTILYSLYYWESELDSLKELGIMSSFQREYDRLFNAADDLLRLVTEAKTQQPIREFKEQEKKSPGFTSKTAFDFINRFSNSWRDIPKYFPWHQFTADQVSLMLGKLLELLHRLKNILADIQALKEEALKPLGEFLQDIIPLLKLMKRLSDYTYEQEKPKPIPLYVSGEIKEITDTHLVVMVEHSGSNEQEWKIPRQDFPEKNPQIGQHFFAKIEKDQPDQLQDIEPLPVREENLEEIMRSLFGDEAYEKISALWEKEEQ